MDRQPQYIRFDWAMRRLLRDKANFGVLEGFLATLLGKRIKIQKLLESVKLADTKILGFVKVGCSHTKKRSGKGYYYYQYYTYY